MHGADSGCRAEIRRALQRMLEGLGAAGRHPNGSQTPTRLGKGEGRGLSVRNVTQAAVRTSPKAQKIKSPDKGAYTGRHGKLERPQGQKTRVL